MILKRKIAKDVNEVEELDKFVIESR